MTQRLIGIICAALMCAAQTEATFEVASVKPVKPGTKLPANWRDMPAGRQNGRYVQTDIKLKVALQIAYKLPPYRIQAPGWMEDERYDIAATMPPDTPEDKVLEMFRNLLTERFRMKLRWERRETAVYALMLGKGGLKFKETAEGTQQNVLMGRFGFDARNKSMDDVAGILMYFVDRPVVNMTGLTGNYDVKLDWQAAPGPSLSGASKAAPGRNSDPMAAFDALPRLGLKAVAQKTPLDFLVIDSAERIPVEN